MEDRVLHTIILALIVALESQQFPGVYDQHIARMRDFIEANSDVLYDPISVYKAMAAIVRPSTCCFDKSTLTGFFYKVQKDVLLTFRTSL